MVSLNSPDRTQPFRVLVLGGYGHFGGRICARLVHNPQIQLLVGGRHRSSAEKFIESVEKHTGHKDPEAVVIDHTSSSFSAELKRLNLDLVIHTCGPFQGQSYRVAESCISADCHYIDLADARNFVTGFGQLNEQATSQGVSLITGASTVPGVSSAVVQSLKSEFQQLDTINICITPGNQTPRGLATLESVLSYCGRPFRWLERGEWKIVYGWQNLKRHDFPRLGHRWLGACDVPDLQLFPDQNPDLQTVTFHAALELPISQWGLWLLSWVSRAGVVQDWTRFAGFFKNVSDRLDFLGSPHGGMFVDVIGISTDGSRARRTWYLTALNGHGPEIPVVPAVILAEKLAKREALPIGAYSSINQITLDEFARAVGHLDISWEVMESTYPDG